MILEGIVTSLDPDGRVNVAPMGPLVTPALDHLVLRPFQSSQTYRNLKARPTGVFHVVDDVLLLARAALNRFDQEPATVPAEVINGRVLEDCCRWFEFEITACDDAAERTRLDARVVHTGRKRDFFGFNRAKHAVLEATILATRLHLLPEDEVRDALTRLKPLVDKTAGTPEAQAWELVVGYINEWFSAAGGTRNSHVALPPECETDPECRLLRELRARPEIFAAIDEAGPQSELALQARLRKSFPDELVRHALLVHELRQRAGGKFTRAERMWFDRVGFEQATAEAVARHKAERFPAGERVWDLCCGIGSDAIALAARGPVTAVDLVPAAGLRTMWNAKAYGVERQIEVRLHDVTAMPLPTGLLHIDPDRRATGAGRANRLEDYVPNFEFLTRLIAECPGGAIKLGPASNFGGKFPQAEIELISLDGECKEATVWLGSLAGSQPFRATVLLSRESLAGHPLAVQIPVTPLKAYLYDPDPAVVRAGLVDLCAERLGLSRLDAAEEYLTADAAVDSPFVRAFRVIAELPNNERELRRFLRNSPFGSYEIKCRHIPAAAESLRKRLPTSGREPGTLFLARLSGQARWVVAQRQR